MNLFDFAQLIMFAMPFGIFSTFGLLLFVILTIKHVKLEKLFKCILSFYFISSIVSGFLFFTYFYSSTIFSQFDMLYCVAVLFTIVLFHHLLCYTIRFYKPFGSIHYIITLLICLLLLFVKILFPEFWVNEGEFTILIVALLFGIVHSVLMLIKVYNHQLSLMAELNKMEAIDKKRAIPFIAETLLFPWVFAACLLITGKNPGVLASLVLMISIFVALRMNIPLTYPLIRHYMSPFNEISLLASDIVKPEIINKKIKLKRKKSLDVKDDNKDKRIYRKYTRKHYLKNELVEVRKMDFEHYFRKYKPFLNPNLSIYDLIEPLHSNRTYISKYINRVYGMNFTSYINLCRLQEIEYLLSIRENKDKKLADIVKQVGFSSYRNYIRALKKMNENKQQNNQNP